MNFPGGIEFAKFLIVGVLNTITGISVIFASKYFGGINDVGANLIGYLVGLLVSFLLNSRWTFNYQGSHLTAVAKFVFAAALAYASNLATVLFFIHILKWNDYVSQALGMPVYTVIFFFASKFYIFRKPA